MRFATLAVLALLGPTAALAQSNVPIPSSPSASPPAAAETMPGGDANMREQMQRFRAVCGADLQRFCGGMRAGPDASREQRAERRQCIEVNKVKFTPDCQAALAEREANREARRELRQEQRVAPSGIDKPRS